MGETVKKENNPPKPIILNAFDMNCAGHINHGLWTHPRDESLLDRLGKNLGARAI
jgi:hypothetical protein